MFALENSEAIEVKMVINHTPHTPNLYLLPSLLLRGVGALTHPMTTFFGSEAAAPLSCYYYYASAYFLFYQPFFEAVFAFSFLGESSLSESSLLSLSLSFSSPLSFFRAARAAFAFIGL